MLSKNVDLSALAEQMCRIEHKLDLIIEFMATNDGTFPLRPMSPNPMVWKEPSRDPLTLEEVRYQMDLARGHVVRVTSDQTGLQPPSPVLYNQNIGNSNGNPNGGSSDV